MSRKSFRRGAATVEFALSVPLLVMILMFSMYLTELVRAKLKLQEMAHYAVWEMTSYTLTDFAKGNHDAAFEDARQEAHTELLERFKDMDSVEPNGPAGSFIARYSSVQGTITNKEIPFLESGMLGNPGSTGEGGSLGGGVLSMLNRGAGAVLDMWGFNNKGWVESEVTMNFDNVIIPRSYLDENSGPGGFFKSDTFGGQDLSSIPMRSKFSMYANGWHLPDGGDAVVRDRRAGNHRSGSDPHGLHVQVERMVFLGLTKALDGSVGGILNFLGSFLPNFFGTFVVARNYGIDPQQKGNCNGLTGYDGAASSGLHAMRDLLDNDRPDCFDSAPFRDEMTYGDSNYIKVFLARGPHFMGCKRAMADDPSDPDATQEATNKDEQDNKIRCEQ
ncbi:TadE/TadG family type IV pilus assembly protein [Myxococcus qinghaiensis]|uniref:TadE/TadG family type IV pilus assembly protein n=1 Tax=Myxococcus qinghaiensis TaxID=2906758 RepID=UPI0020A778DF|nr:TadE family protein [Myxococcus qinghaiensis]MCP3168598.1 pilus assembly protein [Myxococcus qinghaiensis]